jgi:predicted nucleotidyltransferase
MNKKGYKLNIDKSKRYKFKSNDTFMYHVLQKCGYLKTLELFFLEPTNIHFIREISRKIKLSQSSVRNHVNFLLEENMIIKKTSNPFDGFIANRENEDFIFYKRVYNYSSLKELRDFIIKKCYPKSIVLFGSYFRGEDIESSDIDIFLLSNSPKEINFSEFEKTLSRKINVLWSKNILDLDKKIQTKIKNGLVLTGEI